MLYIVLQAHDDDENEDEDDENEDEDDDDTDVFRMCYLPPPPPPADYAECQVSQSVNQMLKYYCTALKYCILLHYKILNCILLMFQLIEQLIAQCIFFFFQMPWQ